LRCGTHCPQNLLQVSPEGKQQVTEIKQHIPQGARAHAVKYIELVQASAIVSDGLQNQQFLVDITEQSGADSVVQLCRRQQMLEQSLENHGMPTVPDPGLGQATGLLL
jgi:hypothetical protein